MTVDGVEHLVGAALADDQEAWNAIVARFERRLWLTARACGLNAADAADAVQTAWLRLVENLDSIRDPARIGGWLTTTTRNEASRLRRRRAAERLVPCPPETAESEDDPVFTVIETDGRDRLAQAIEALHEPCRTLLGMLLSHAEPSYARLAAELGVPLGSIGPTRSRCLARLRARLAPGTP
ncbi:RNA polymerase sigma factor [Rhizohabitans arisaemae]|uniref:RNA polymerase sigma factor n=1 Tax=Rhizohabitans arisaemae TaxID=2720610 RepID=UPI0024B2054A|nr:sigma-70 family RNA polymerase sigma factor [Rhizohabitans arisaemae]